MLLPLVPLLVLAQAPVPTAAAPLRPPAAAAPAQQPGPRAAELDAVRLARLKGLVEEAEKALEAGDEEAAAQKADEADVFTSDWPTELLKNPDAQGLVQRLKDLLEQLEPEGALKEPEPGLKAQAEVTPLSGEELRQELDRVRTAEQGGPLYDFPIDLNDKVLTWVRVFSTTIKGKIETSLSRGSQFLPIIRQVFAEEGLPQDLAFLPLIESGYRVEVASYAKAVGMWQFMSSTGRSYGLTINKWVDERRDPVKATRAAARLLRDLYTSSGDWYLALAGYNAGPLYPVRAAQNLGTKNFWDMYRSRWLRTQTKNYVPEMCAAVLVGRNPEKYGLQIDQQPPFVFETVPVNGMTSLRILAQCAGESVDTLHRLNPELLRGSTPPGSYTLRVPPGKGLATARNLAATPAARRADFKTYKVRRGDTLAKVARRFKVDPEDLLAVNDMTAKEFRPGKRLEIPPAGFSSGEESRRAPAARDLAPLPQTPAPAPLPLGTPDTRSAGAPQEGAALPPAAPAPRQAEPSVPAQAPAEAPAPAEAAPEVPKGAVITARKGDTLAKIARARKLSFSELLKLNPDHRTGLHPGDKVQLPASAQAAPKASARGSVHVVRKGETLTQIAGRYGVTVEELKRLNHMKSGKVRRGQKLKVAP